MSHQSPREAPSLGFSRDTLKHRNQTPYFLPPELWLSVRDHLPEGSVSALSCTERSKHKLLHKHLLRRNVKDSGTSCLPFVAALGDLGRLRTLQDHHSFTADVQDKYGDTALLCTILEGQEEFAIVSADIGGPHVNLSNSSWSPLSLAIAKGQTRVVRALLQVEDIMVNGNRYQSYGRSLFEACSREYPGILQLLLTRSDIDLSTTDESGRTPLRIAAENGLSHVARVLLNDRRVPRTSKDASGLTALSSAILHGHFDIIEAMHTHNIRPTGDDLQLAKSVGETFKASFLSRKWSRARPTASGYSMMTCAAASGNTALVGAFLPLANKMQRKTALLYAAAHGNTGTLKLLLQQTSPRFLDAEGRSPAWYALQSRHHRVLRLIRGWYSAQNDGGREGQTQSNPIVISD